MDMHKGMSNKSPKGVDKSMTPPKGSVDNSPVRTSVAKSHSMGPRCA